MQWLKYKIRLLINSILLSYSQVFFSDNRIFAVILLMVSWFDYKAGICGALAVLVSNLIGISMGFNKISIKQGLYGYNSLLVGIGLGHYYEFSIILLLLVCLSGLLSLLLTVGIESVLRKYGLPFLSIPFILTIWIIILAARSFSELGLNQRGIYNINELYSIGGLQLVNYYNWLDNIPILYSLKVYFLSLGAIFFQYNLLSGILISIGLLIYSRIGFSLSLLGFYSAYIFYKITGANLVELGYNYIGFNFILTAIGIGGFFVIPKLYSYLWVVVMLPIVVIISLFSMNLFQPYQLSIYSLPFNFTILLFLYALKLRINPSSRLIEVAYQQNSPEKNLYFFHNSNNRFKKFIYFPVSLPFWGDWKVSQGHNGEYTHKEDWQHAWDFQIFDETGKVYKSDGNYVEDYFCYNKSVISPADGIVEEVVDGIRDNRIGDVNIEQNWGNTIVIKHVDYLYSKLCHLKSKSIKVKKGDSVRKGDIIATVGNSGRSAYPHLHFQLQATPFIESKTLNFPISQFVVKKGSAIDLQMFDIPKQDDVVSNIEVSELLKRGLHFLPGQKFRFKILKNGRVTGFFDCEVQTDINNYIYFYSPRSNSFAYFYNNGGLHFFKNYIGDKSDPLFLIFLALFKMPLCLYPNLIISDNLPVNFVSSKASLFLHDFVAPFYQFISSKYTLASIKTDDDFSPKEIIAEATIETFLFNYKTSVMNFQIWFNENGLSGIKATIKKQIIELRINYV